MNDDDSLSTSCTWMFASTYVSKVVKHVESTMRKLEMVVMQAVTISKIYELGNTMKILKKESNRLSNDELHHIPLAIFPFFIGRTKEIEKLEKIL